MRFWLRTLTHVNFNHVNKIETRYKVLRLNVKLSEVLLFTLTYDLSCSASILFICESKFYPHTHVKTTRQWKSTLRLATCIVKLVIIKDYWSALISLKISKPFLSKRNFK